MNLKMAFLLHCVSDPLLAVSNCTGTHAFIRSNVELWGRRWNVLRGVLVGNKHAIILLPTILPVPGIHWKHKELFVDAQDCRRLSKGEEASIGSRMPAE